MKKYIVLLIIVAFTINAFAKTKEPEWVQNHKKVYPNSEYLAQRGSGTSAEKARTDATAALSRYFQTNVSANLSTTMSSVTSGESVEENTVVVDDVNVQSQVDFFGLEYTEPYYHKPEKKWYCVVYMNRAEAWENYRPQIEISRNSFNSLYKNLTRETDSFTRLSLCRKVWEAAKELLQKLEYGRIISPKEEAAYQDERDRISQIPVLFEESRQNCSIYLRIDRDYNRTISAALSAAFRDCGFRVTKTEEDANYTAEVSVDDNIFGENPLSIKPDVSLKVTGKTGKTVYSYERAAKEKAVGYTLESARKKAYPKLAKEIEDAVRSDLAGVFKL